MKALFHRHCSPAGREHGRLARCASPLSLFAVAILTALLAGCSAKEHPAQAAAPPPVKASVVKLERAPVDDLYTAPGTVRARQSAIIAAKVPGYIQEMRAKPGDTVRAGQVLVVLAANDLDAQVSRASAGRLAARNAVAEAEKMRLAAGSNAHLATATYERYRTLLEKRSVSRQEFDEAEARHKSAQAAQQAADAAIARARAGEEQAEAELRGARITRGYATLTAPFAGMVSEKQADPGTLAMPGQPLLVLDQAGALRLEATVEESRIAAVRLGDTASVSIEAAGLTFDARVSEIVPAIDPGSRAFTVKLDLPANAARQLRTGMFGRATFRTGRREAVTVPAAAVRRYGQLQSVFVVENGVARQRLVTLGAVFGDRVEVLSGLEAGERVVASAAPAALRDGSRIEEVRP